MNRRGRPPYPDILTPREWEVLGLVDGGHTNDEIASRLGISIGGVKFHVSEILGKLHLSNRTEAAHWYRERRVPVPLWTVLLDWLRPAPQRAAAALSVGVTAVALAGVAVLGIAIACTDTNDTAGDEPAGDGPPTVVFTRPDEGFVYMDHVKNFTYRIAVFDTDRMAEVASFEVDSRGSLMRWFGEPQAALAGDRVIVNYGNRIASYALDGSDERTLREAGARDGWPITNSAVSPDGTVLAVADVEYAQCPSAPISCHPFEQSGRIILIDLKSLATLQEIPHSAPGLDSLRGWVSGMYWFGDGSALTVQTRVVTYDLDGNEVDAPGGTAVVGIDGLARRLPFDAIEIDSGQPGSRNGRYAFTSETLAQCDGYSARLEAAIYDLQTGETVARARPESRLVSDDSFAWSPDGSELMYSTLRFSSASEPCTAISDTDQWDVLHANGSPVETNVDPVAVMDRWHGDRRITYTCDGERVEPYLVSYCGSVEASFRGQPIATNYYLFQVLGWID